MGVENRWEYFKNWVLGASERCCGVPKMGTARQKGTAWWLEGVIREKKKAWNKYFENTNLNNYSIYREKDMVITNRVKDMVKRNKVNLWIYFRHKLAQSYRENQKLFFGVLKSLKKTNSKYIVEY